MLCKANMLQNVLGRFGMGTSSESRDEYYPCLLLWTAHIDAGMFTNRSKVLQSTLNVAYIHSHLITIMKGGLSQV